MFSVLVLTLNEERNLPRCLASTAGCDDLVVLDSGSTDGTWQSRAQPARGSLRGRSTISPGSATTRNARFPFHHPWVFHLDADETIHP